MKNIKKLLAVLLAATLLLSLSVAALADDEPGLEKVTSTVAVVLGKADDSNASASHTWQAFKLMDLYKVNGTPANEPALYQYKLVLTSALAADPTPFMNALDAGFFKLDPDTGEITLRDDRPIDTMVGQNESESAAANLAAVIAHFVVAQGLTGTTLSLGTAANLECGYWIIYETANSANDGTVATKPILLDLRPTDETGAAVTQRNITLKDASVTLEKTVNTQKEDTVAIGDNVEYKVVSTIPVYEARVDEAFISEGLPLYQLKDTLDTGLTFDETVGMTVTISGVDNPVAWREGSTRWDYKFEKTTESYHDILTVTISPRTVLNHQGATVTLEYEATINENVSVCADYGNKNKVVLTYSNNPEVITDSKTLEDKTTVYSFSFCLHKLDGSKDVMLEGAKYSIYNADPETGAEPMKFSAGFDTTYQTVFFYDPDDGDVTEFTTSKDKYIVFFGLNEGTYYLKETEAPTGYAILAEPAVVTVTALKDEDGNYTGACRVDVSNATTLTEDELGGVTLIDGAVKFAGYGSDKEDATSDSYDVGDYEDNHVIIRNYKGITLPETGSINALLVAVLGLLTLTVGAAILLRGKKHAAE